MLPLNTTHPKAWCPVRLGIPGPLVCRTSAHNPSELTGQILVGAEGVGPSPHRLRAECAANNTSLPHGAGAANRTRVSSVPGTRSATEPRRLEALIGFEPMTCSFGRSRAGPLRYRAENWGTWRESNPLAPDSQSGPAPFGFSHHGARPENRTPVCWLRISGSAPELSERGGATGIRTRTSPLKRRVCLQ